MYSIGPADARAAALQQLAEIQEDPPIQRLALRHAGHADVAYDALQSTYYAIARLKNLEQIDNLRPYFCKVLIHEVYRELGQLGAALVEDFALVTEAGHGAVSLHPVSSPSIEDAVRIWLLAQCWFKRLADERDRLRAAVPARSGDPGRYRAVIYSAAEQVLRHGISGEPSDADSNGAFRAAYPEYFAQPDASANLLHQRFRRAREDLKALLQAVVRHDELT